MEYNFRKIEQYWQDKWKKEGVYKVSNDSSKPKYYVLDMFPYPSGAGLHVGHPLGYIASDIYARFKRLKGYNVLHPMGYDAFGLPAEQYAIDHGIHPAVSTEANIKNFRDQLDKIGFCFDWDREVNTSKPGYYKWTQWIFLQLFDSFYNRKTNKAERISALIAAFKKEGNKDHPIPNNNFQPATHDSRLPTFSADEWKAFDEKTQQDILMEYRLAYCGVGEVNWCEALGTVLANDEVINGVSERGGYPVVRKKLRQWYMRITEYADRLLEGLAKVDFSEAMKEMQTNWIGKSSGAEIEFRLTPGPSPHGEGKVEDPALSGNFFQTADKKNWGILKDLSRENRKNKTEAEDILWQELRNNQLGYKVRRQHVIDGFIIDFAFLQKRLLIEVDGGYHENEEQKRYDEARTEYLTANGYKVLRFTNEQVIENKDEVVKQISEGLKHQITEGFDSPFSDRRRAGDEALKLRVYTTRPDTIFGVDFMVIAPEHELVEEITTPQQKQAVEEYIAYVKSRNERERMAEKKITGVFTGAYAVNPFNGRAIPVWISEYVLAGYGTGAIMAVPCGDERDHKFAKHFNIPVTNIIGSYYNGEEANPTKDAILENSDFINGMLMKDAIDIVIKKIEEMGIGIRKVNYKMRDAAFSRQRYWGEPIPIIWKNGIAYPLDEKELPLELPHVDSYKPGPEGEGPLANIEDWVLIPDPSPQAEKGAARVPKYAVHTPVQYELAKRMRKEHTEAEGKLWELLRGNKVGIKFRRQHPIDAYIVDFVSLQDRLIVEADGGYHNAEEQKKYDEERTRILNGIGFKVIRFSNEEILKNPYAVRDKIKLELNVQLPSPLVERGQGARETNTMPGYAGSSWYFLRYMDPDNQKEFCDRKASDYWGQVDLYIGGTEHAVGHLLYSRMWTKVLYDLGYIGHDEPYKKLVNQGMIQGSSRFVYRVIYLDFGDFSLALTEEKTIPAVFITESLYHKIGEGKIKDLKIIQPILDAIGKENIPDKKITGIRVGQFRVDVNIVDGIELNIEEFKKSKPQYSNAQFIKESDGKYICGSEIEKMSKSKFNTVNPDDLVMKYGADTFRMYEMFLGPVEMSKPWDTKGIEGVHRFLKKLWRLFFKESNPPSIGGGQGEVVWNDEKATEAELKVLHKTIKKIEEDTERFSFNTGVSAFMIAVNELTDLKCHKKEILEPLLILLAPYAPQISEELWKQLGNNTSILNSAYPKLEEKYLVENSKEYPVSINGKMRTTIDMALGIPESEVEKIVLANAIVQKWLEGKPPKKIIYKEGKMVNVVV